MDFGALLSGKELNANVKGFIIAVAKFAQDTGKKIKRIKIQTMIKLSEVSDLSLAYSSIN
jgi:hypothetical protein